MTIAEHPILLLGLILCSAMGFAQQRVCPDRQSEPLAVDGNAPIFTLNLMRVDGSYRPARFVFDSGGGAIILDQALATDLGLRVRGPGIREDGQSFSPIDPPLARFGLSPVSLATSKAFLHLGQQSFDTRESDEGLLPGKALEPYQVVLDYPAHTFGIAPAGCIAHRGIRLESSFVPESGHPQIQVSVDHKPYEMLLDTGSRVTLVRRDILESLSAANPGWPHAVGASGSADMPGSKADEFMLRVPELRLGPLAVRNILLVSRPDTTYRRDQYETPGPIVGAVGGNVLRNFRVEIDYPDGTAYFEQKLVDAGSDMDSVGLVLDVDPNGKLIVAGITSTASAATRKNIRPGDEILAIEGKRGTPWTIVQASNALSGAVGESKHILLRRHGKQVKTFALVAHLL